MESYSIVRYDYRLLPSAIESLIFDFLFPRNEYKEDTARNREIELYRQHKNQSVIFTVIKDNVIAVIRCIFKTSDSEKLPIEYSMVVDVLDNDSSLKIGEPFKIPYVPCAEVGGLKIMGELSFRYRILLTLINACEYEIHKIKRCDQAYITCGNDPVLNRLYTDKCQFFNKAIVTYGDNKNWVAMRRESIATTVRPVTRLEKVKVYTPNMSAIILQQ